MITIMDVARARGVTGETVSAGEFHAVGLAIFGGCQGCGAAIAAYNAYPSKTGYWQCAHCIHEEIGYQTVEEFEADE